MDEDTLIAKLGTLYYEREISEDEIERRAALGGVVCCVWPDKTKPHGFDFVVLKGDELLGRRGPGGFAIIAIPCKSLDDAIRIKNMYCDP
jgi:hypothetical protein